MLIFLFYCTVLLLAIEVSYVGKVMGFFQKEFVVNDLVKLVFATLLIVVFLVFGSLFGNLAVELLAGNSLWYASTILFILGIKLFYNGIKLHKVKQQINPLQNKGLIVLSILIGLNAFFVGLSFGLIQLSKSLIFSSFTVLFIGILLGYFTGLKLKNLNSGRYEFLLGIFYVIIAISILII